ncbi:Rad9-domain-containing protein [Suillus ampliporus]|nr:Rad9-domain-containing protein [Suillus ampliporus]
MQATLSVVALKPFIRALTCLSRYGDDVVIYADPEHLSLSATNSSLSAYCRFKYGRRFFSRYKFRDGVARDGVQDFKGQLLAKTLLSILKHKTIEKTVERCEFTIVEATDLYEQEEPDEDQDTLESRLIIRMHCKHGIVKTHRLPLLVPTSLLSPGVPDSSNESRLTIGPRAIKDITEHFPNARGAKSDPQLVWTFGDTEVEVKSLESSIDTRGKAQLSTELTISADEFDVYDVYASPTTIAFHLREFNATIAFAESMGLCLDLRFTDPAAPLFIDVEGDESECLFVISTSQVNGSAAPAPSNSAQLSARKRPYPNDEGEGSSRQRSETPRIRKPMKAVQRMDAHTPDATSTSKAQSDARSMPPPSYIPQHTPGSPQNQKPPLPSPSWNLPPDTSHGVPVEPEPLFYTSQLLSDGPSGSPEVGRATARARTPLFYPLSQLSQADKEVIRGSGLGIENMNQYELEAMLEGEGEEVDFGFAASQNLINVEDGDSSMLLADDDPESLELFEDTNTEFGPTQDDVGGKKKAFQPLFED